MTKKIAILSDIHSNSLALEAALDYIDTINPDLVINLGDTLYGPIDPVGTYNLLKKQKIIHVAGNEDVALIDPNSANAKFDSTKKQLTSEAIQWIKELTSTVVVENDILCFHGTPDNYYQYLIEAVTEHGTSIKSIEQLEKELSPYNYRFFLCGHSHVSHNIVLENKVIINPGSVGLPAYDDDEPFYHTMENHSPLARFSVLSLNNDGYNIQQISVPYNWKKAAEIAKQNGRDDWVKWLTSGKA